MTTIPFGKYKSRLLSEIMNSDASYLVWLVGQDWFADYRMFPEVKSFVDGLGAGAVVSASASSASSNSSVVGVGSTTGETNDIVSFGKYKGQKSASLLADVNYCKWLVSSSPKWLPSNNLYTKIIAVAGEFVASSTSSIYEKGGSGIIVPGDAGTVSFGKYKGQDLSMLFKDVAYCSWAIKQDFMKNVELINF